MKCNLCPRNCNVDRQIEQGFCKVGKNAVVSRAAPHMWEEPCISGTKGSGTIFFAGCNLGCRFCQNFDITVKPHGTEVSDEQLAYLMLHLQGFGVANVNLVTAAQFVPQVASAIKIAKEQGLSIPVVYNSGGYEKVEALKLLQGLVDVYLPDLKFCSAELSQNFAAASNYFSVATAAIEEMRRQQPTDEFDGEGYVRRGIIVRHLVLPGHVEDTKRVLDWLSSFDKSIYVSLMAQYFPAKTDEKYPELNRKLYKHEYRAASDYFFNVGLVNGFGQDPSSATVDYLPNFDETDVNKILEGFAPYRN